MLFSKDGNYLYTGGRKVPIFSTFGQLAYYWAVQCSYDLHRFTQSFWSMISNIYWCFIRIHTYYVGIFAILWTLFTSKSLIIYFCLYRTIYFLDFFKWFDGYVQGLISYEHIRVFVCFFWQIIKYVLWSSYLILNVSFGQILQLYFQLWVYGVLWQILFIVSMLTYLLPYGILKWLYGYAILLVRCSKLAFQCGLTRYIRLPS